MSQAIDFDEQAEQDESGEMVTTFNANYVQHQFITAKNKADLFSSRMGEGKTAGLCWACWYHTRHNPGAKSIMVRDTWENCRDTTLDEFMTWFRPMGEWHEGKKTFTWRCDEMRGRVRFMGLNDEQGMSKLQSRDIAFAGIDEPASAAGGNKGGVPESIFDIIGTRTRQKGMNWYAIKLAQNNPDEAHWTYRRFVKPGDPEGKLVAWQTDRPENMDNLPTGYYDEVAHILKHRPDLYKRFVEGKYGFTQEGRPVTPEYDERLHLTRDLKPLERWELYLLWDFGLDPTCVITQPMPNGRWHILEAILDEDKKIGVEQLINERVRPIIAQRYDKASKLIHIGDPAGNTRESSDSDNNCVATIQSKLRGRWIPGPISIPARVDPLRAVLSRHSGGVGTIRIDEDLARPVHFALRGGWHYKQIGDVTSKEPVKDRHSHPGDCMGYGAAKLFPHGDQKMPSSRKYKKPGQASYGRGKQATKANPFSGTGAKIPKTLQRLER